MNRKALQDMTIGVICGGYSREREVSLRSGEQVGAALERLGYNVVYLDPLITLVHEFNIDLAFNVLHGEFGEDGGMQSLLEEHGIPYVGSGVKASVLGMNKWLAKQLFWANGIPTSQTAMVRSLEDGGLAPSFVHDGRFPKVVKPVNQGSSVDVYIVHNTREYTEKMTFLLDRYGYALVEEYITGKEITVSLVEGYDKGFQLPILELRPKGEFYDYASKYTVGGTEFILPATLSSEQADICQAIAAKVFRVFGAKGFARVDMIVDPEKGPFVLEINTVPGFTLLSDLPASAKAAGLSFDALVACILETEYAAICS